MGFSKSLQAHRSRLTTKLSLLALTVVISEDMRGTGAGPWGDPRMKTSPKLCQARQWKTWLNAQILDGISGQSLNNQITLCLTFLRCKMGVMQVPFVQDYGEESEVVLERCRERWPTPSQVNGRYMCKTPVETNLY